MLPALWAAGRTSAVVGSTTRGNHTNCSLRMCPSNGRSSSPSWPPPSPWAISGERNAYDSFATTRWSSRHGSTSRPSIPPSYPTFASYSYMPPSMIMPPPFSICQRGRMTTQTHCPAGSLRGSFLSPAGCSRAHACPWGPHHPLIAQLQFLLYNAMATSTWATYSTGTQRFLTFCRHQGVWPLLARKPMVVYFIAELSRSLTPSTVVVYVVVVASSGRAAWPNLPRYPSPAGHEGSPTGTHHSCICSPQINHNHNSHGLLTAIKHSCTVHRRDRLVLSAAFTLAFFGLLRISEFTVSLHRQFDPRIHPTMTDILWVKHHFTFHIRHSKTDQYFKGHTVHLPQLGGRIFPFTTINRYIAGRGPVLAHNCTPLFTFTDSCPLTRSTCLKHLRRLLRKVHHRPAAFNTHSFRIRAATSAALSGIPSTMIKHQGRWRSSAYWRYIWPQHGYKLSSTWCGNRPPSRKTWFQSLLPCSHTSPPLFIYCLSSSRSHTYLSPHSPGFFFVWFFPWVPRQHSGYFFPWLVMGHHGSKFWSLPAPGTLLHSIFPTCTCIHVYCPLFTKLLQFLCSV